jgi:hypothetical protein
MKFLNGYYKINDEIIENKLQAFIKASSLENPTIRWWYYNETFHEAAKKYKTRTSITELYRQRAQQLRDSYDYLILNYSGGADSHNILQIFLKNNIKLDAIYVQWPESLMDKGLYTPNYHDKSNANFHSEWDLVLKKDLEWIGQNHPEILIEIGDWTKTVKENFYTDDIFTANVSNLPSIARAQKQNTFSRCETQWSNQGKRVASIFGVDKTSIVKKNNEWFFYFVDTSFMTQANPENPNGCEYFYHTPMFPEIAVEQAIMLKHWFLAHPEKQYLILDNDEKVKLAATRTQREFYAEFSEFAEIFKLVCYPYWDFSRFQADKPFAVLEGFKMGARAWDNILTALPDFHRAQQRWEYNWKSYLSLIDKTYLRNQDTLGIRKSKAHLIPH